MASKIIMPQGGQDITEGVVVAWLKREGEGVCKGDVICEVETEKAVFEVNAPEDGVLLKIVAPAGARVPIFSAIGWVGQAGETLEAEPPAASDGSSPGDARDDRDTVHPAPEPGAGRKIKISGRAQKLAIQRGIDPARVTGTGPNGRITERDVLAVADASTPAVPTMETPPRPADTDPRGRSEGLSKRRQVIARRLLQSKQTIPHFYVTVAVDMTAALELRRDINAAGQGTELRISLTDMIVRAVALALEEFTTVNCQLDKTSVVYLDDINIGIAVALDEGLVVPVLPRADRLSLGQIAAQTRELVAAAKAGKQANLCPGTFTVSNMGMLDVENFTAIINPPESAILAVGSVTKTVVAGDQATLQVRDVLKMTLSVDHRLIDGALAARFVNKIKYHLQQPKTLL